MILYSFVLVACPFAGCEVMTRAQMAVTSDHELVTGKNTPFATVRVDTDALRDHVLEAHPA